MEVNYSVWGRHGQVDTETAEVGERADYRGWHHGYTERMGYKVAVAMQGNVWHLMWKEDSWDFQARKEAERNGESVE